MKPCGDRATRRKERPAVRSGADLILLLWLCPELPLPIPVKQEFQGPLPKGARTIK